MDASANDDFSPGEFMRGGVSKSDDMPDGCGVPDRKTRCLIVTLDDGRREGFLYHAFDGFTIEPTGIVLLFRCVKDWPDPDGEVKAYQTFWRIMITGKRLDPVVKQISEMVRYTLFPGGVADDDKPFVSSITVMPIEPDHWQG